MKTKILGLLVVGLLTGPLAAQSAVISSVDRATFQAAVTGGTISEQNFDGLANTTVLGTLDGVTYSASTGSPEVTSAFLTSTGLNGLGRTPNPIPNRPFFLSTDTATFAFASAITAFAIDINTFADTDGAYSGTLNTGDIVTSLFETFPGLKTGQFIGFVSNTPFTSVTISALSFSYTLDTLVYGDAAAVSNVPEPEIYAMMGIGLALMGFVARRRQQQI